MLLSIAKLQNLKAIHNQKWLYENGFKVVINRKTTKFESNSQQKTFSPKCTNCCYQSQNYKIWKQFTTSEVIWFSWYMLLSIAKLQNLKAIHNQVYKFTNSVAVVINRKTTKFESNSQLVHISLAWSYSCYQSQNYKIWKQFTTKQTIDRDTQKLLSIAKLQNLKAIHNG